MDATFTGCSLKGDFIDSVSDKGDFNLNFVDCTVEGAISTGVHYHPYGEPEEAKWWLIGTVEHTLAPNDNETGINVKLSGGSKWIVTKNSCLNSIELAEGAVVAAPEGKTLTVTNYGEAVELKPGKTKGKIIITVS